MFFLPNPDPRLADDLILSATDIVAGSVCEFAAVRKLDVRLGRIPAPAQEEDAMGNPTAALGDKHEAKVLGLLRVATELARNPTLSGRLGKRARARNVVAVSLL
ncbi:hypothetical protein [Pseudarthrobacter sp. Y6]|uniref:hypothetical protein n=1 Tax=Pseudarthrobacter sp. Y6 TaxID=3418422 RepID=UPI003CEA4D7F